MVNTFKGVVSAAVEQSKHKANNNNIRIPIYDLPDRRFFGLEEFWGQSLGPNFPSL